MSPIPNELVLDFAKCQAIAAEHYENFSVVSLFIPRDKRPHFASIYAFCRGVDDIGDEYDGDRLAALDSWEEELRRCYEAVPTKPSFRALQHTIEQYVLPMEPFLRLIEANRRDQTQKIYRTFEDLCDYCRYSANPVGHLVLGLFGYQDETRKALSDYTCTALQIANHLQDLSRDVPNDRFYLPESDLGQFGSSLDEVRQLTLTDGMRSCIQLEVERTEAWFLQGAKLESMVPRRLSMQLKLYRLGGQAILSALKRQQYDSFSLRPTVSGRQKLWIAWQTMLSWASQGSG